MSSSKIAGRILISVLTAIIIAVTVFIAYGYIVFNGPSPTARNEYTAKYGEKTVYARLFGIPAPVVPEETELPSYPAKEAAAVKSPETDTSVQVLKDIGDGKIQDQYGLIDYDGDGVVIKNVSGEAYEGKMIVVWDPKRVILGSIDLNRGAGYTLLEFCEMYDAIAGINAGGFTDNMGTGNGGTPFGIVITDGSYMQVSDAPWENCIIDKDGNLKLGYYTIDEMKSLGARWGASFGPALIIDGQVSEIGVNFMSGLYARSVIGQRDDGAILLLVVDGIQAHSAGCRGRDIIDIMNDYHAVSAYNLDGGASTCAAAYGE
nr:phosphodiester glycosidase family protein [Oscillospiraceae bacterium]